MRRILFIGPDHTSKVGGREQLSRLHQRVLGSLFGDRLDIIHLERPPLRGRAAVAATFTGRIDGLTAVTEASILGHIETKGITHVWLDGSNLGRLAALIKRKVPHVTIFCFFHNIEPRFFLGAFRQEPSVRAAAIVAATFVAERMAARHCDRLVVLNRRDGDALEHWHRRAATDVLPMAIEDGFDAARKDQPTRKSADPYLLFVGGSFYANKAGIAWFAREVAPHIAIDTLVVGKGMDGERAGLEASPRIRVVGAVDDLAPYYRGALVVVAPIFDGSGMKTKVAEAWMHGKAVIGTREAFTGYEQVAPVSPCSDAAAFAAAINAMAAARPLSFDPELRRLYESNYSPAALATSLERMIAPDDQGG